MESNKQSENKKAVTHFFEHDHRELDRKFEKYRNLKEDNFSDAREFFLAFYDELNRHIEWEENILFPMLEDAIGEGLTGKMRFEHEQIQEILETIRDTIQKGEAPRDETDERLLKYLEPHNDSEETIVYPAVDKHLDEQQIEKLFDEIN